MVQKSIAKLFGGVFGLILFVTLSIQSQNAPPKLATGSQVSDADKRIRKLFNVKGTPTYHLLDRDGKIVAKDFPFKRLNDAITELLKK